MKWILIFLLIIIVTTAIFYFFPQLNFRPMPSSLLDGHLTDEKPNWVSSKVAKNNAHYITPLKIKSLQHTAACIKQKFPEVTITQIDENRLIGYRTTRVLHFVDWFFINADGNLASTATMGHSDFGKNRELVEKIRTLCS